MAINKDRYKELIKRLDDIQKEIDEIHQELLIELDDDELSEEEAQEIDELRAENDYRTFEEWQKEKPLD